MFLAVVNVPGYIPENDPVAFDTPDAAWRYLADERRHDEDDGIDDNDAYSSVVDDLENHPYGTGTVWGFTPGGRIHDLGLAYSVTFAEDF